MALGNLAQLEPLALYKIEELAPLLRASDQTLRRYCVGGVFENATKIGRDWLIPGSDVMCVCPHLKKIHIEQPLIPLD